MMAAVVISLVARRSRCAPHRKSSSNPHEPVAPCRQIVEQAAEPGVHLVDPAWSGADVQEQ